MIHTNENGATAGTVTPLRIHRLIGSQKMLNADSTTTDNDDRTNTPEFILSYGAYSLCADAGDQLRDAIAKCDNAITLMEAARSIEEAQERLALRMRELQTRVNELYFPTTLFPVAA
jgi:hypothetical protein